MQRLEEFNEELNVNHANIGGSYAAGYIARRGPKHHLATTEQEGQAFSSPRENHGFPSGPSKPVLQSTEHIPPDGCGNGIGRLRQTADGGHTLSQAFLRQPREAIACKLARKHKRLLTLSARARAGGRVRWPTGGRAAAWSTCPPCAPTPSRAPPRSASLPRPPPPTNPLRRAHGPRRA